MPFAESLKQFNGNTALVSKWCPTPAKGVPAKSLGSKPSDARWLRRKEPKDPQEKPWTSWRSSDQLHVWEHLLEPEAVKRSALTMAAVGNNGERGMQGSEKQLIKLNWDRSVTHVEAEPHVGVAMSFERPTVGRVHLENTKEWSWDDMWSVSAKLAAAAQPKRPQLRRNKRITDEGAHEGAKPSQW